MNPFKYFKPYEEFVSKPLSPSISNLYGPQYIKINNMNTENCILLNSNGCINEKPLLYDYITDVIENPVTFIDCYDNIGLIPYDSLYCLIDDIKDIEKLLNSDKKNKDYLTVGTLFNFSNIYPFGGEYLVFSISSVNNNNFDIYLSNKDFNYFTKLVKELLTIKDYFKTNKPVQTPRRNTK